MNKERRKALAEVLTMLQAACDALETLKDDEQEAFDNMPEGLQQSDRGQATEAAAQALDNAHSSVAEAIDYCEGVE